MSDAADGEDRFPIVVSTWDRSAPSAEPSVVSSRRDRRLDLGGAILPSA